MIFIISWNVTDLIECILMLRTLSTCYFSETFYCIDYTGFGKVKPILNLGILLEHKVNFKDYILMLVNKANRLILKNVIHSTC